MGESATIKEERLKKWRYSVPLITYPHDILLAQGLPLIFAGDAFGGRGRVEGAYLSELAAGKVNIQVIAP
jgi:predicted NAD/FAD-dependent oxidoreductase